MATVFVDGQKIALNPSALIGKGGEADIYQIDKQTVLKLYKKPNDPDYVGNSDAQQGAVLRIKEHQYKLPDFPPGLPYQVIYPRRLAYDKNGAGTVIGYTMQFLDGKEVLLRLADRQYRDRGGISPQSVVGVFLNLHTAVEAIHTEHVVIGDFNDLNVLFDSTPSMTYLVDADSMQFSTYFCRTFTARFLDPLLSDPTKLLLIKPHTEQSDWYAFNTMLFQCMLYVGPYGGVHRPQKGKRLQHDARVLQRVTLFNPDVVYPKPALSLNLLPDALLDHFHKVYEKDLRVPFPKNLLEEMNWKTCNKCALVHARGKCPECAAPGMVKETVVIRGKVTATKTFTTRGQILYAVVQKNKLRYLYHENGEYRREGGLHLLNGNLGTAMRFRISQEKTLIGSDDRLVVLGGGVNGLPRTLTTGTVNRLSMFDANDDNYFWIAGDQLVRSKGNIGSDYIGTILADRTMFWVGKKYGFVFYQAGLIQRSFVWDVNGRGLGELNMAPIRGQLVDAACVSSENTLWFMTTTQENGKLINTCAVIHKGSVVATESAHQNDDTWLNNGIRGHFATGTSLFIATDDGIERIALDTAYGTIGLAETFPDTEPFVDTTSQLLPGPGGIYVISPHEITILRIQ